MAAPKSGFEAWLRSTMADMRQQWEISAYGRPVTGELVYPVTGIGQERANDPQPLQNKERSGSEIEAPDIGMEAKDGKVPPFHMTDDRGLEEFKATRASLEPQKPEARFSDLYGSEHYPETAPHVQADAQAHRAWAGTPEKPAPIDELTASERARFEQMKAELQTQSQGMQSIDRDRSIDR